jgi:hypothetical protein
LENVVGEDSNKKKGDPSSRRDISRWPRVERIFALIGAIASLVAIIGVVVAILERTPIFERQREEAMVSSLVPGEDFARLVQIIGSLPDFHERLHSGMQLCAFDRRWEYIQLLVNNSGMVSSVGIYAKTSSFKAKVIDGFVINGPPIDEQTVYQPLGVAGACAASWYDYFEGYTLPASGDYRSVIFGAMPGTDTSSPASVGTICRIFNSGKHCIQHYDDPPHLGALSLDAHLLNCMRSINAWQYMQRDISPALVIVTAPNQPITADMLNEDFYFYTG